MRGTCSWSALLLRIPETSFLHWSLSAQVSWLGLCGPETKPMVSRYIIACLDRSRREREKLHYVHSASLAYEDGSVFMPFAEWL